MFESSNFSAQKFLYNFRAVARGSRHLEGIVKRSQLPELEPFMYDGEQIVAQQIERTQKMVSPENNGHIEELAELYTESFVRVARGLGVISVRLRDRKISDGYINALQNHRNRYQVLTKLAADFRSINWRVQGEELSTVNPRDVRNFVALYYSASQINALQAQYPDFAHWEFKQIVLNRAQTSADYARRVSSKISELTNSSYSEYFPEAVIRRAVLTRDTPVDYLDTLLIKTKELLADPKYSVLGKVILIGVLERHSKRSLKKALDQAVDNLEQLQTDERFSGIHPSTQKFMAARAPFKTRRQLGLDE